MPGFQDTTLFFANIRDAARRVPNRSPARLPDRIDPSVLPFWQAIEALSPQPLPKIAPGNQERPVFALDRPGAEPPWLDHAFLNRHKPAR